MARDDSAIDVGLIGSRNPDFAMAHGKVDRSSHQLRLEHRLRNDANRLERAKKAIAGNIAKRVDVMAIRRPILLSLTLDF
jgi:hypothetical protein